MRFAIVDDNIEEIHMTKLLIRDWCGSHNITVCCDTFTEGDAFCCLPPRIPMILCYSIFILRKQTGLTLRFLFENFTEDTDCLSDLQLGISCGVACHAFD